MNRSLSAVLLYPVTRDSAKRPLCAWCRERLPRGKRRYCRPECEEEVLVRCHPNYARMKVHRRDKGICCDCGIDTERIKRMHNTIWRRTGRRLDGAGRDPARRTLAALHRFMIGKGLLPAHIITRYWFPSGHLPHLWEADHVVAVVDGGDGLGLANLVTRCTACHKRRTAAQARVRADRRRGQASLLEAP